MADKAKDGAREPISADKLRSLLDDLAKKADRASEMTGALGQATSHAVDQHGLDRNALTQVRRLRRMEETKAQAYLLHFIEYAYKDGHFDQFDAFNPIADLLREILEAVSANQQPVPSDDVIPTE